MQVTFVRSENTAKNIKTLYFKPNRPVRYTAGQFTELTIPHDNSDKRGVKRWFTLSSSPTEELLSITIKFSDPSSSFKKSLLSLKNGAKLSPADPMGDFVLPKNISRPLVFIAGGVGITPYRSMVKWLSDMGEKRSIHLLYAVNNLEELAFNKLFEEYGLKFDPIVTEPPKNWQGLSGKLSAKKILDIVGPISNQLLYISGPEPMVETLEKDLLSLGLPKEQLVTDFFPGYTAI